MKKQTASHSTVKIMPMSLRDIVETRRVFVDAVENHFEYLDPQYRKEVLRSNSLLHLALSAVRPRRYVLVSKHRGRIVGYVIGSAPRDGRAQIYWLFVDPSLRGSNIGLKLLSRILKLIEQSGATEAVLITHSYAKYYMRQGFKLVDTVKRGDVEEYILSFPMGKSQ